MFDRSVVKVVHTEKLHGCLEQVCFSKTYEEIFCAFKGLSYLLWRDIFAIKPFTEELNGANLPDRLSFVQMVKHKLYMDWTKVLQLITVNTQAMFYMHHNSDNLTVINLIYFFTIYWQIPIYSCQ